jgi:hypothetical protein
MQISEMWKQSVKEIINMTWKGKINQKSLDAYLNRILDAKRRQFPVLGMRNIYTNQGLKIPLDDIFDIIKQEDLCIEGNNTLTYSYLKVKSPIPKILIDLYAIRSKHKKKAKELSEQMTKMRKEGVSEEDPRYIEVDIQFNIEDSLEKAYKILMNSIYGVQGQNGSIIFSPDTAGAVTGQGRALISEMMWSIERFLYGTIHFTSFSEFLAFLNRLIKEVDYNSLLLEYISYYPTKDDLKKKFISILQNIPNLYQKIDDIEVTLYHFINNLDDIQCLYLYYKCDFLKLIIQNPKVFNLLAIMLNDESNYNSTSEKDTPPQFIPILKLLADLVDKFVIIKMPTANRTIKYNTRKRRGILLSDTDSIVINLHPFVKKISQVYFMQKGIDPSISEHLIFKNETMCFKIVNILSYLCTFVTKSAAAIFCESSNIPEELRNWISMKNEFYFMRIVMYTNAKKNYITYIRLNEGKVQDEVTATGIKLNSSVINQYVHDKIMDIIEYKILKVEQINPVEILKDVKMLEQDIINRIMNGDITYGKKGRYSGPKGYKNHIHTKSKTGKNEDYNYKNWVEEEVDTEVETIPGVYTNNVGRSCYIWNLLYPSSKINIGEYAYIFGLTIEDEEGLEKLKNKYPDEYERIKSLIFHNKNEPFLPRYGLRSIAIPVTDTVTSIPSWIIDFIDYPGITNKHLQPIISLLPSICIHKSRISSSKSTYSPLIAF